MSKECNNFTRSAASRINTVHNDAVKVDVKSVSHIRSPGLVPAGVEPPRRTIKTNSSYAAVNLPPMRATPSGVKETKDSSWGELCATVGGCETVLRFD
jgi:hypothetical protein